LDIQKFLNKYQDTQIAITGVGSPGNETDYFGALTKSAVIKFQQKYADEVLNSVGLYQATGYWGVSTRKQANKLLGCNT